MKLGLISDIHNHIDALMTALKLFADLEVDQILCMGDMIQPEGDYASVLNIIRHNDILAVFGNHEQEVINQQGEFLKSNHPNPSLLDPDLLTYLSDLPFSRTLEIEGKSIYMTHASPWDENRGLYFRHQQSFKRAATQTQTDIILVGHTHLAGHVTANNTQIYNPGAVWDMNHGKIGTCAMLTLPEMLFEIYALKTRERQSFSRVID